MAEVSDVRIESLAGYVPSLASSERGLNSAVENVMRDLASRPVDLWTPTEQLADRLLRGDVVLFTSEQEKEEVLEAAEQLARGRVEAAMEKLEEAKTDKVHIGRTQRQIWDAEKVVKEGWEFQEIEEEGRRALVRTWAGGRYEMRQLDSGVKIEKKKRDLLGHIRRLGWKNPSMREVDANAVTRRVRREIVRVQAR